MSIGHVRDLGNSPKTRQEKTIYNVPSIVAGKFTVSELSNGSATNTASGYTIALNASGHAYYKINVTDSTNRGKCNKLKMVYASSIEHAVMKITGTSKESALSKSTSESTLMLDVSDLSEENIYTIYLNGYTPDGTAGALVIKYLGYVSE